jgi:hypothetical protein
MWTLDRIDDAMMIGNVVAVFAVLISTGIFGDTPLRSSNFIGCSYPFLT